ncbi:MAG: J domain-containing protein [Planctomycetes bacterium]|nr:J domain-containing protein [Planctomycetota bacterium]
MNRDECYRALGVSPGASHVEIKHAFRRLAMQHSPDRHPDDEEALAKYRRIVEAYRTLSDPDEQRRRELELAEEKPKVRGFKSFEDMFTAYTDPGEVRCEIRLKRRDVRSGCDRLVQIRRFRVCAACHGRSGESPCKQCGGAGKIEEDVEVKLRIPAGIKDGALLRLPGEGDLREEDGRREDVYCRIKVE